MLNNWTEEQNRMYKELLRVCEHLSPEGDLSRILMWLGVESIKDSRFRATMTTVHLGCLATPNERKGWEEASDQLKRKSEEHVRTRMNEARQHILVFYASSGLDGPYKLEIPKKPPPSTMKGRYTVVFNDVEVESTAQGGPSKSALLRPASSLWTRMLASDRVGKTLLVYPIAQIVQEGKTERDDRGLFSGSGEVAAVFALGACIPHLRKKVNVLRTKDVTIPVLRAASSLIFLGSTVNNPLLSSWREDMQDGDRWPTQSFLTGEVGGVGTITKVRGENQRAYPYEVIAPRTHEIDYVLVSHFRDRVTDQALIALQGISSPATAAAADYMCDDDNAKALQKRLGIGASDRVPCFELLLQVHLRDYVAADHVRVVDLEPARYS